VSNCVIIQNFQCLNVCSILEQKMIYLFFYLLYTYFSEVGVLVKSALPLLILIRSYEWIEAINSE